MPLYRLVRATIVAATKQNHNYLKMFLLLGSQNMISNSKTLGREK